MVTMLQKMDVLIKRRIFDDEGSLQASAYRSLLTLHPEFRLEIALSMYEQDEVSLGRAAEISGISREQIKEILVTRGIQRKCVDDPPEKVREDVNLLLGPS